MNILVPAGKQLLGIGQPGALPCCIIGTAGTPREHGSHRRSCRSGTVLSGKKGSGSTSMAPSAPCFACLSKLREKVQGIELADSLGFDLTP